MKLLNRVSVYYLVISLLVFSFGGVFFYFVFKDEIYEELDEQLRDEKRDLERILANSDSLDVKYQGVNFYIESKPTSATFKTERKDTSMIHPFEGEQHFRQWRFSVEQNNKIYAVTLRKSLIDVEDLAEQIAMAMFYAYLAFIFISVVLNYVVLKHIFNPFYKTLTALRKYSLNTLVPLQFSKSKTTEFNQLNSELSELSKRIISDYRNIKEFNQNASHEIQTPLAIIKNKLELLMQSNELKEADAELIVSSYETTHRLSKLVQSLLLLTKIENHEFGTSEKVNLFLLTKELSDQMNEEFDLKNIVVKLEAESDFVCTIHSYLSEILIRNLLSNVLRYTEPGGKVVVHSTASELKILNSGVPFSFEPELIFKRFFYAGNSSVSQGIGLSLAKKIAESFELTLEYSYLNGFHCFTLKR
ncbi:MAG: sensor histidine kinase [Bacteroidota bacterium]